MHRSIGYAYHYQKYKKLIKASFKLQMISVLIVSAVAAVSSGAFIAYSGIIGAACAIFPNLCFAYYSFRYTGASKAKKVLHSIYLAEACKFVLAICLLTISNSYASTTGALSNLWILIGFGAVSLSLVFLPKFTK